MAITFSFARPCMRYHHLFPLPARAAHASSPLPQPCSTSPASLFDLQRLLDRPWLLPLPDTKVQRVTLSDTASEAAYQSLQTSSFRVRNGLEEDLDGRGFYVIRDDLLHPIMGGNKLRKLDAVLPALKAAGVSDVVTCGGCQSAHTAAVAVAAAESGICAHLLLRGESPDVPTGHNLVSGMFGHVRYIQRSEYADREVMLTKHAAEIAGSSGTVIWLGSSSDRPTGEQERGASFRASGSVTSTESMELPNIKKVAVIKEGAGDALALLGLVRLVEFLCRPSAFGCSERMKVIVDCGTGTTAIGLALGVALFRLPWQVVGVMLSDTKENYEKQKQLLLLGFRQLLANEAAGGAAVLDDLDLPITWVERHQPRRFGNVRAGEIELCRHIARQTGVLLDPIYTLAAWEAAVSLCGNAGRLAILHTGGTLNLFGLSQRYPADFK